MPPKEDTKFDPQVGELYATKSGAVVEVIKRDGTTAVVKIIRDTTKCRDEGYARGETWNIHAPTGVFCGADETHAVSFKKLLTKPKQEKETKVEKEVETPWDETVVDEVAEYRPAGAAVPAPAPATPAPTASGAQAGFDAMFQAMVLAPAMAQVNARAAEAEQALVTHLAAVQKEIDRRIANIEEKPRVIKIKVGEVPAFDKEGYVRPEFKDTLLLAANRVNTLLVGPAGSGKTHLAREVAEAMKLRFSSISCSAGMSESQLTGWLLPTGDNGKFEYVKSNFIDIYENGGVFLFDELDAADSNTLLFINQALSSDGFSIPQRFNEPFVKRHPDCVIIAAANTYGTGANMMYSGRDRLDESTLDRFRAGIVTMGYDANLEKTLIKADLLQWGQKVREGINKSKLNRVMSTRFLIDATKLYAAGKSFNQIKDIYFTGWTADERAKVAA